MTSKTLEKCAKPLTLKWAKGDRLERIAQKYKLKSWKPIWNHVNNRAIVKKRKKPENLQPGDVLVIPPDEKEQKRLENVMERFEAVKSQTDGYIQLQEKRIDDLEKKIESFYKVVDKYSRRKFDSQEVRQIVDLSVAVTTSLESMLDAASDMPTLFGTIDVTPPGLTSIVDLLHSYQRNMKGGVHDDVALETLKKEINKAKSEIAKTRKRIQDANKDLLNEAVKALNDFCKIKTLEPTVSRLMKAL